MRFAGLCPEREHGLDGERAPVLVPAESLIACLRERTVLWARPPMTPRLSSLVRSALWRVGSTRSLCLTAFSINARVEQVVFVGAEARLQRETLLLQVRKRRVMAALTWIVTNYAPRERVEVNGDAASVSTSVCM
jgi:hypothetical protein